MQQAGERWQLGHRPALDGLRGVAILLVLVGHVARQTRFEQLAEAGVLVFFVLSGFLITALLLAEHQRAGRLSLARFYLRRARRLLPALFVMLTGVTLVGLVVPGVVDYQLVAGALSYSANWFLLEHHGLGTALSHTWSLSIEEQFYLAWPLLLVGLTFLPRRARLTLVAAGAAGSATIPLLLWPIPLARIYYATDTRAMPLLTGCLVALWLHGRREGRSNPTVAAAAGAVLVALVTAAGRDMQAVLTPQLVAVAAAVMIVCVAQGRGAGWLEPGWLVLVGRRSYGLYLWHWPIFVVLMRAGAGPLVLTLLGVPLSWGMALASWRWVERRFLSADPAPDAAEVRGFNAQVRDAARTS